MPEFRLILRDDMVERVDVLRGAPCGATWDAAKKIEGLRLSEALARIGLETQFFCSADPAGWDPIYEKSPVHIAAHLHTAAFRKAAEEAEQKEDA
jgi:hypothetical protein